MDIPFIAVGNGEKCPWCDVIITEENGTEHLLTHLQGNEQE